MPVPIIYNEKPATLDRRDGLEFVFTTTHPAPEDRTHDHYHDNPSQFKPHR